MADLANTNATGTGAQPMPVDLNTVATVFTQAFDAILRVDATRKDASDLLKTESEHATNTRLSSLIALANAATHGRWSAYDVEQGIDRSLSRRNKVDASTKTFASEIKRACHAKARGLVANYVALAGEAWAAEAANVVADKKAPTPCRKAFARQYHLVQRMLGEAIDGGRAFAEVIDICDFAVANDPDLDYAKVFKRLRAIRAQIAGFAQDFPVPGFADVIEYIDAIEKDDLKSARAPVTTPEAAPEFENEAEAAAYREALALAPDVDPITGDQRNAPAPGVSDILADALADIAA